MGAGEVSPITGRIWIDINRDGYAQPNEELDGGGRQDLDKYYTLNQAALRDGQINAVVLKEAASEGAAGAILQLGMDPAKDEYLLNNYILTDPQNKYLAYLYLKALYDRNPSEAVKQLLDRVSSAKVDGPDNAKSGPEEAVIEDIKIEDIAPLLQLARDNLQSHPEVTIKIIRLIPLFSQLMNDAQFDRKLVEIISQCFKHTNTNGELRKAALFALSLLHTESALADFLVDRLKNQGIDDPAAQRLVTACINAKEEEAAAGDCSAASLIFGLKENLLRYTWVEWSTKQQMLAALALLTQLVEKGIISADLFEDEEIEKLVSALRYSNTRGEVSAFIALLYEKGAAYTKDAILNALCLEGQPWTRALLNELGN